MEGIETVGEIENYFSNRCCQIDKELQEPAGCRNFLNWFDETPRLQMLDELGRELDREINRRSNDGRQTIESVSDGQLCLRETAS
jgi:hypothetical protein